MIFNRNLLALNHKRMASRYSKNSFLHHEIASRMLDNIDICGYSFENGLEICGLDNFLSKTIVKKQKVKNFLTTNLVRDFESDFVIDDEELNFKEKSFDLIVSNLNLHFINNLEIFLLKVNSYLSKSGIFVASFFGEQNLLDLKNAVINAEMTLFGSASPRFIPTIELKTISRLFQKVGFTNVISSLETIDVNYAESFQLLQDIKNMGQGNILLRKSTKFVTKEFLDEILKNYSIINKEKGLENKARFEVIIITGFKK